jgi:hypothetical protein
MDKKGVKRELFFVGASLAAIPTAVSTVSNFVRINNIEVVGFLAEVVTRYREFISALGIYIKNVVGFDAYVPVEACFLAISLTIIFIYTYVSGKFVFEYDSLRDIRADSIWVLFNFFTALMLVTSFGDQETTILFVYLFAIAGILATISGMKDSWRRSGSSFRSFTAFCIMIAFVIIAVVLAGNTIHKLWVHEYTIRDLWVFVPVYSFFICVVIAVFNARALPAIVMAVLGLLIVDAISNFFGLIEFRLS